MLVSVDALRNPISIERLQGPIVMITAVFAGSLTLPFGVAVIDLTDDRAIIRGSEDGENPKEDRPHTACQ